MKKLSTIIATAVLATGGARMANAVSLLTNGNLDVTYQQEIVPGFFLPKPANWVNEGFRTLTGPYEDEMSSEPWAGPAPTPVTADDFGIFFKPFSGNVANGPATGHLYQDNPATPGATYSLSGWAGGEANLMVQDAQFALEFLDAGNSLISSTVLSLLPTLTVPNGQAFSYKQYSLNAVAPAGAATVRARVSMIGGLANPQGGGQAFVADDFELLERTSVPEQIPAGFTAPVIAALLGAHRMLRRKR